MAPLSLLSAIFPPPPNFTDKSLPSLTGKVIIITGAASGVGFELAKIIYLAGGTVYIAARTSARCEGAISNILEQTESVGKGAKDNKGKGKLASMVVDLANLGTVKPAVEAFLAKEKRLDVLVHNAAVMTPPAGSKDKLGHDLEVGTNCLAPYLMTLLLEPILVRTTTTGGTPAGSVRIVWVATILLRGTPPGGMSFQADGTPVVLAKFMANYVQSKVGVAWLADKFAKRLGQHGILSVSLHPGLMRTELQRNWILPQRLITILLFKPAVYGAYTELYAAFSPEVTTNDNGGHLMAWGRKAHLPKDVEEGLKSKSEGGSGAAEKFFEYCEKEINTFL